MPRTEISAVVIPPGPSPRLPAVEVGSEPVPSRFRNGSRRPCGEYEYTSVGGGGGGVGRFSAGFAGLGAGGVDVWGAGGCGAGAAPCGAGAGFAGDGDGFCGAGGWLLGADAACGDGDAWSAVASAIGATRTNISVRMTSCRPSRPLAPVRRPVSGASAYRATRTSSPRTTR